MPDRQPNPDQLASLPTLPHDEGSPVFAEPWQAQAFALAVRLSAQGHFTWKEWATALADELKSAVQEVERVGKDKKWICVESYRNEREKANLLYWQLTCMSFYTPEEWIWLYREWGYTGDYGFIFFE